VAAAAAAAAAGGAAARSTHTHAARCQFLKDCCLLPLVMQAALNIVSHLGRFTSKSKQESCVRIVGINGLDIAEKQLALATASLMSYTEMYPSLVAHAHMGMCMANVDLEAVARLKACGWLGGVGGSTPAGSVGALREAAAANPGVGVCPEALYASLVSALDRWSPRRDFVYISYSWLYGQGSDGSEQVHAGQLQVIVGALVLFKLHCREAPKPARALMMVKEEKVFLDSMEQNISDAGLELIKMTECGTSKTSRGGQGTNAHEVRAFLVALKANYVLPRASSRLASERPDRTWDDYGNEAKKAKK
jgi:hypothetical protein